MLSLSMVFLNATQAIVVGILAFVSNGLGSDHHQAALLLASQTSICLQL